MELVDPSALVGELLAEFDAGVAEAEKASADKMPIEVERLIHALFVLLPAHLDHENPYKDRGFALFAFHQYVALSSSVGAFMRLWRQGYYQEALLVQRQLIEVFGQLRYFDRHPQKLGAHLVEGDDGKRRFVRFRTIFDELCPGLYETLYMPMSNLAHGGAAIAYRTTVDDDGSYNLREMNRPDEKIRDAVLAPFVFMVYAFVSHAPRLIGLRAGFIEDAQARSLYAKVSTVLAPHVLVNTATAPRLVQLLQQLLDARVTENGGGPWDWPPKF